MNQKTRSPENYTREGQPGCLPTPQEGLQGARRSDGGVRAGREPDFRKLSLVKLKKSGETGAIWGAGEVSAAFRPPHVEGGSAGYGWRP